MEGLREDDQGLFWISYNKDQGLYEACVEISSDGRIMATEVSRSLEDLLQKCERNELTEKFAGLDHSAIARVSWLINIALPAVEFVEGMWNGPSSRGPIGFPMPPRDE